MLGAVLILLQLIALLVQFVAYRKGKHTLGHVAWGAVVGLCLAYWAWRITNGG